MNLTGKSVDDLGFIGTLMDELSKRYRVDPKAIYIAGQSNGAMLAYAVGARYGDRVAAIAAVSGTVGIRDDKQGWQTVPAAKNPISVLVIHGDNDSVVAYDSRTSALINGYSANASARWWWFQFGMKEVKVEEPASNTVTKLWRSSNGKTEVEFVTVKRGTHDWPKGGNGKFSATSAMWDFFRSHRRT